MSMTCRERRKRESVLVAEDYCPLLDLGKFVLERREKVESNALETITAPVKDSIHRLMERQVVLNNMGIVGYPSSLGALT